MPKRMVSTIQKMQKMVDEDCPIPRVLPPELVKLTLEQRRRLRISVVKHRPSKQFERRWAPMTLPRKCLQRYSRKT